MALGAWEINIPKDITNSFMAELKGILRQPINGMCPEARCSPAIYPPDK